MGKRFFSMLLVASLLAGLLFVVPASAASVPSVTLSAISFTEGKYVQEGSKVSEVKPGDKIAVKVTFTNITEETIWVSGYSVQLSYDKSVYEPYSYSYFVSGDEGSINVGPIGKAGAGKGGFSNFSSAENLGTEGTAIWNGTGTNYKEVASGGTAVLGYLLLKVKDSAENGDYEITFTGENTNYVKAAASGTATSDATIKGIDYSAKTAVTVVKGAAPTIESVSLSSNSVTVNGKNTQTVQATATSTSGKDITNAVTWRVANGDVTIDQSGLITIPAKAKAANYIVTASAKEGASQGEAKIFTLNVVRETSIPQSIEIGGEATIAVPMHDFDNNAVGTTSQVYTATSTDQFGDTKPLISGVTWELAASYPGVTMNDGVLTVTSAAAAGEVTIKATSGSLSAEKTIQLTKDVSVPAKITLSGAPTATIYIPAGDQENQTADFTATVVDQYNQPMSGQELQWQVVDNAGKAVSGIEIPNGTVTVTKDAADAIEGSAALKVICSCGTVTAESSQFTVARAAQTATSIQISKDDAVLSGDTDTVTIPTVGKQNIYTYTAQVFDQYGSPMDEETATLAFETASETVTFSNGTVTVLPGATKDSTYTLTATCSELTRTITITAKDIDITWPTATIASAPTYGMTWDQLVTLQENGSAKLDGQNVNGKFTLKTTGMPDAGDQTYVVNFKGSLDGVSYDIDKIYDAVNIAKRAITVMAGSAEKPYDGTPLTNNTASITEGSLVEGQQIFYTVTGTVTNVGDFVPNVLSNVTIKSSEDDVTSNYEITMVNGTLTVTARDIKDAVVIGVSDKEYTGSALTQDDMVVTIGESPLTKDTDYTVAYQDNTNYGTASITLTGIGNYTGTKTVTFQITKTQPKEADYTVTLPTGGTYDGQTRVASATKNNADIGDITVKYNGATTAPKAAGTYAVTIDIAESANYAAQTNVSIGSFTIAPKPVTITGLTAQDKVYDGTTAATVTGTPVIDGLVDGDTVQVKAGAAAFTSKDVGTRAVTFTGYELTGADAANYTQSGQPAQVDATIEKATITIAVKDVSVRVGSEAPTYDCTITGLAAGETLATPPSYKIMTKDATPTEVTQLDMTKTGTYTIVASSAVVPDTNNYNADIVYKEGTLSVTARSSGGGGGSVRTCTLSFETNGGTTIVKVQKSVGATIDLTQYAPTRTGYDFAGWYSDKGLTRAVTSVKLTGDTTVYAKWTEQTVAPSAPFTDVKSGDYFFDAVLWATQKGITSGTSATTFAPDAACTRAQTVTFLWRAMGSPAPTTAVSPFADVTTADYYHDAVLWAVEKGITNGTSDTTFSPNDTVTRAQVATFLWRMAGSSTVAGQCPFTDVDAAAYYHDAVLWAMEKGVTNGTSDTTFSPDQSCTRGQIVTFLYRYMGA